MAYIAKVCKVIDNRRKIIQTIYDKLELEDKMARRL